MNTLDNAAKYLASELLFGWDSIWIFQSSMGCGPRSDEFRAARLAATTMTNTLARAMVSADTGFDYCAFLQLAGMTCQPSPYEHYHSHTYEPTEQYLTNWAERHGTKIHRWDADTPDR